MTREQIEFIKSLDKDATSGTIQSILIREDLQQMPYTKALEFLIRSLKSEKDFLIEDNIKLSKQYAECMEKMNGNI